MGMLGRWLIVVQMQRGIPLGTSSESVAPVRFESVREVFCFNSKRDAFAIGIAIRAKTV